VVVPLKGAIDPDVSDARALPELECLAPARLVAGAGGDPDLDAKARGAAAFLFGISAQFGELSLGGAGGGASIIYPSPHLAMRRSVRS
jgi:hypothetical protein